MKFLYPEFLWALFLLAIPVIIHLFSFRRYKRIVFTNVRFLVDIQQTTSSKRKLKQWLVLISRLLTIAFLVLAFAQPYFPEQFKQVKPGTQAVSVFIDNSFTMSAVGQEGELLEVAKSKARELAAVYQPDDRFQLLTQDFEGRHQRLVSREDFLKLVDEVKLSPASHPLDEIAAKQTQILNSAGKAQKIAFVLSDFQQSMLNQQPMPRDTVITRNFVLLQAERQQNLVLDTCWLASPFVQLNQPAQLIVRLKLYGDEDIESFPVSLKLNGVQKAIGTVNIKANSEAELTMNFTVSQAGWQQAEVSITDNPVTFDDNLYFTFPVAENLPILAVQGKAQNPYITGVYASDPYFKLSQVSVNQMDYSTLAQYRVIILDEVDQLSSGQEQELRKYLSQGGTLLIIPSSNPAESNDINTFLANTTGVQLGDLDMNPLQASYLNTDQELFDKEIFGKIPRNIDLPKVQEHYTLQRVGMANEDVLMKLPNGDALLSRFRSGQGTIYLSSVPFTSTASNLVEHALFVPFMYRMALLSGKSSSLFSVIGNHTPIALGIRPATGEQAPRLTAKDFETIPEQMIKDGQAYILVNDQVSQAGFYQLRDGEQSQPLAFNYNRRESAMSFADESQLEEKLGGTGNSVLKANTRSMAQLVADTTQGNRLWKACIAIALLFLAIEVLLLRFLK